MARMERVRRADHSVRLLLLRKGDDDDDDVVKESGNGAVNRMESVIRTSSTT